jgi:hypothetical protein
MYEIIKYSTMQQVYDSSEIVGENFRINYPIMHKYHNIIRIEDDIIFLLYYDWFPHILFSSMFTSEFYYPSMKLIKKLNKNYSFLYWHNFYNKIKILKMSDFMSFLRWEEFEIVESCRNCLNIKKLKFQNQIKKYCDLRIRPLRLNSHHCLDKRVV